MQCSAMQLRGSEDIDTCHTMTLFAAAVSVHQKASCMRCVLSEVITDVEVDCTIGNLFPLFSISSVCSFSIYAPSEFIDVEMMQETRRTDDFARTLIGGVLTGVNLRLDPGFLLSRRKGTLLLLVVNYVNFPSLVVAQNFRSLQKISNRFNFVGFAEETK